MRGRSGLDDAQRIFDRRSPHINQTAEQRLQPVAQQTALQRTWLGAPEAQVVLDDASLRSARQAGVELGDDGLQRVSVLRCQVGRSSQDAADTRVELLEQGATDAKLFPDLLKRLARGAKGKEDADAEKKGYERGLTEGRNAALEEMRAQGRQVRGGPDLARKGPGGGSLLTAERYRSMSPEERRKLSPEEIDRMTAEYVAQFPRR